MIASLLDEVCHDVCVEPTLQALTGEKMTLNTANKSEDARLDISARGFWVHGQRAFYDVRIFDPLARSYRGKTLSQCYKHNESEKKRHYNERVLQIENGTFTPLVFSATGGMGMECAMFFKRLSMMLTEKRNVKQSIVASWIRTKTSFALLRSALLCVRGSRNRFYKPTIAECDIEIDVNESSIRAF